MTIPRQLPLAPSPDEQPMADLPQRLVGWLKTLGVRLPNWVQNVSDTVGSIILRQVDLAPTPDSTTTVFTVSFGIETDVDGFPKALLIVDGLAIPATLTDPPEAGRWLLRPVTNMQQQIVLGTAPTTTAWFAHLVSRRLS